MNRPGASLRNVLLALVSAYALFAQRDLATLVGTVTDSSGAVLAGAQVTITETETGVVYSNYYQRSRRVRPPGAETIHV